MDATWTQDSKTSQLDARTSIDILPQKGKNASRGFDPMIDRGASYAHAAIDKAANVIKLKDVRDCITEHPFKSIGVATVVGMLVGKLLA